VPPREAGLHGVRHDSIAGMDPRLMPPGCFDARGLLGVTP
jgi:hypothetical protein